MNQTHLGLSDIQVKESIQKFGTNAITQKKPETLLMLFLKQFQSPLVYILCIVAVITLALREYSDSVVILFVFVLFKVLVLDCINYVCKSLCVAYLYYY